MADSIAAVYGASQLEKLIPIQKTLIDLDSPAATAADLSSAAEEEKSAAEEEKSDVRKTSSVAMAGYISKFSDDDRACRSTGGHFSVTFLSASLHHFLRSHLLRLASARLLQIVSICS